jgi:signal transduction histidine kinase
MMNKSTWRPSFRSSIFSKLLATMLGMIAILVLMVAGFFAFVVFPNLYLTSENALEQYTRLLTMSSPSFESAKSISKLAHVEVRYQGPGGRWTTSETVPSIEQIREGKVRSSFGHHFYLENAPQGGTYLVVWNLADQMHATHVKLLWMLLILIVFVVLAAYWIQRRHLRPVRALGDGMTLISAGDLGVVLPVSGHDEFAMLTMGFNDMVSKVKQMILARDQLLLDVSHELRSPLTRMKVALALLPNDADKAGIDFDIKEMETMIAELLELERLRSPNGLHRENQDLVPILREVARSFEDRHPGVRVGANSKPILVNIDGDKIHTVLRNLLENAFKYSFPDSRPVDLSAQQADGTVIVRVRDDGAGIPESQMSNIFEPFFRVDLSRSKKTGGYGLGLSICKRITEAHGGTIQVQKNLGRGTSFILTLRYCTDSCQTAARAGQPLRHFHRD